MKTFHETDVKLNTNGSVPVKTENLNAIPAHQSDGQEAETQTPPPGRCMTSEEALSYAMKKYDKALRRLAQ